MSNSYFHFKQFTIWHDKCAMKVGTDSVLLGSWVNASDNLRILDIGTGTGILAMMLAQKTTGEIDAIEIDADACNQARENISNCKWKDRISLYHQSFQEFIQHCTIKYDLIISNPPYFENKVIAPDHKRAAARHSQLLPLDVLVQLSKKILAVHGRLALILPYENRLAFIEEITKINLWVLREMSVHSSPGNHPIRVLFEVSEAVPDNMELQNMVIKEGNKTNFTDKFVNLTKDFYLKF